MDFIILSHLPMPVSVNAAYCNRKGGRYKSKAYQGYEREIVNWAYLNHDLIRQGSDFVAAEDSCWLQIDAYFCFPTNKLVTKAGNPKRHDVDNRLKVLNDCLGKILHFDDCRIAAQRIEKVAFGNIEEPFVSVCITRSRLSSSVPWLERPPLPGDSARLEVVSSRGANNGQKR